MKKVGLLEREARIELKDLQVMTPKLNTLPQFSVKTKTD